MLRVVNFRLIEGAGIGDVITNVIDNRYFL